MNDKTKYPYGCTLLNDEHFNENYITDLYSFKKSDIHNGENKEKELYKTINQAKDKNVWALLGKIAKTDTWVCLQVWVVQKILLQK